MRMGQGFDERYCVCVCVGAWRIYEKTAKGMVEV